MSLATPEAATPGLRNRVAAGALLITLEALARDELQSYPRRRGTRSLTPDEVSMIASSALALPVVRCGRVRTCRARPRSNARSGARRWSGVFHLGDPGMGRSIVSRSSPATSIDQPLGLSLRIASMTSRSQVRLSARSPSGSAR